ncbi:MAG: 16S rRNA (uracil(1498)-N(3))-methyltransferase [Actinomycetota bacterium]|nr:16S rRNA (uracil(1498)-N(3))-methyltransferase [Actinomycetota bacterium]
MVRHLADRGPWFVAPPGAWTDDVVVLPPDEAHHAVRVLRLAPPDVVTATDGQGTVARCAVSSVADARVLLEVLEKETVRRPRPEVAVYQGAAKGHKNDEVVEKLGELGVAETLVYESKRSVARWDAGKVERLNERWAGVARSAAKQSRNPFVMAARAGLSWSDLLRRVSAEPVVVVLWEEASLPLRTALLEGLERVAVVVGPEGGLERSEAEGLADAGGQLVSLGPRILRTENAALVTVAALQYHYGVIG